MLRARVVVVGIVLIGASLFGCRQSPLSASWEMDAGVPDASRSDTRHPYDAGNSRDLISADPAVKCANRQDVSRDPRSICAVRCRSTSPASDVLVSVDETFVPQAAPGADGPVPGFVVHIVQTVPTPCDQMFTNVQTLWSGDFMNFSGQNGQWQFHLLPTQSIASAFYGDASAGGGGDQNVEVYPLAASINSGPVDVESGALICLIFTN